MSLPVFQLLRPKTLDEAVGLMAKHDGDVKVVAGGTDLLPSMKQKLFTPGYVLDLRGVAELRGVKSVPGGGRRHRCSDDPDGGRAVARDPARLSRAVRGGEDRRFAGDAQHGHAWAAISALTRAASGTTSRCVAQELRLLPQERRRSVPCGTRRKVLLGGLLGRYAAGAALSGAEIEIAGPVALDAYRLSRLLCQRRNRSAASGANESLPASSAGIIGGMARQLSETAGAWQY